MKSIIIKPSVIVIIPAYNEEDNLGNLLKTIEKQEQKTFDLKKIIITSDGSSDNTVNIAKEWSGKNSKISVVANTDRKGKAYRINEVLSKCDSEIVVILDSDILIEKNTFLDKLIQPIIEGADLAAAMQGAVKPTNFFGKILYTSSILKNSIYMEFNKGNNIYTCQGHSRALSKKFYNKLHFVDRVGEDAYSYLFCVTHGFKYAVAREAMAKFTVPENFKDHQKQSVRFFRSTKVNYDEFGLEFVKHCYKIPTFLLIKNCLLFMLKYPIYLPLYISLVAIMRLKAMYVKTSTIWEVSYSTKKARADA